MSNKIQKGRVFWERAPLPDSVIQFNHNQKKKKTETQQTHYRIIKNGRRIDAGYRENSPFRFVIEPHFYIPI